jgi:hypothetical protein
MKRASKSARAHKRDLSPPVPPCKCERLPFPHRHAWQCDDFALALADAAEGYDDDSATERAVFDATEARSINGGR